MHCNTCRKDFAEEQLIQRAFLRVARHLHELWEEGHGAHTRLLETPLILDEHVDIGRTCREADYREHVIPCAWIRNHCFEFFSSGGTPEQVAPVIRRLLKIVKITQEEADRINMNPPLRAGMPHGWSPETGDVLVRLTEAGITLEAGST